MKLQHVELYDAVQQHNDHPDTFAIPDSDVTLDLHVGDMAKVACNKERFWVRIEKVTALGEYVGKIANQLFQQELRFGMLIPVSHSNVYDVMDHP